MKKSGILFYFELKGKIVNDDVFISDSYVLFLKNVGEHFGYYKITSRICSSNDQEVIGNPILAKNLLSLGCYDRLVSLYLLQPLTLVKQFVRINRESQKNEFLALMWPSPVSFLLACLNVHKKILFVVRSDESEIVKSKYFGIRKQVALMIIIALNWALKSFFRKRLVLVVGKNNYNQLKQKNFLNVQLIKDPVVSKKAKSISLDKSEGFRVLYVGRLEIEKGCDILIEALEELSEKGYDISLVIIGSGSQEFAIRKNISIRIQDRVSFMGHLPFGESLFHHYQSSDLLVIPSRSEGFPKVIYEALQFSLPILAFSTGGMSKGEKVPGMALVEEKSPIALANAIKNLIDNKLEYKLLKEQQQSDSKNENNLEFWANKTASLIKSHA